MNQYHKRRGYLTALVQCGLREDSLVALGFSRFDRVAISVRRVDNVLDVPE